MANKLVIVESPAKAKTIGKFLKSGYKVIASNGHVRDLPKSQLGVDTDNDFTPKYITIRGRGDIIKRISKEAKAAKTILLATDPDREGEAISWHLSKILGIEEGAPCRVEFNEITEKAVQSAITHARPIDAHLVNAQQARRILDRLVGYKISPLLWAKVRKGLSAGRVQSVATRIIVDREHEINAFEPKEYWSIDANLQDPKSKKKFRAKLSRENGKKLSIDSEAQTNEILKALENAQYKVEKVTRGEKRKHGPAPFTTSNLQQEASRKLGFTTKRTMLIAQQLYEGVEIKDRGPMGLVSYIRTDSTRVSLEAQASALQFIEKEYGKDYVPKTPNVYRTKKNAQDAHEAIRPSYVEMTPQSIKDSLTPDQFKLYRLIYNRFLSSQMSEALFNTVQMDISADRFIFRASGETMIFPGFTAVYIEGVDEEEDEASGGIPPMEQGDICTLIKIDPAQHFTQPPPRFTEAMLVRALEERGIGRPSTYSPTISTIIDRGYVSREKKLFYPTELGEVVTNLMCDHFKDIVDVEFTAEIEEQLDGIAEGTKEWTEVLEDFYRPFEETLHKAESTIEKVEIKDVESDIPCDKCGAMMVYKQGRFGTFLACPKFPECRNTKAIVEYIDSPCPKCSARLVKRHAKKGGRIFYGCEKYPDCDFVSWDMPAGKDCPQCGAYMVTKQLSRGVKSVRCSNRECGFKEADTVPAEDSKGSMAKTADE